MTDPGPDGSGVGAATEPHAPSVFARSERAEDREAKALQDHGDPGMDETEQIRDAERIAQQPDF